jgi:hypothetical protein
VKEQIMLKRKTAKLIKETEPYHKKEVERILSRMMKRNSRTMATCNFRKQLIHIELRG